jgi:hypothetical protein
MSGSPPAPPPSGCDGAITNLPRNDVAPLRRRATSRSMPMCRFLLLLFLLCPALSGRAFAASNETGTATGLSGSTSAAPTDEVQIFSIGLTGDGNGHPVLLRLTLADVTTTSGISASEISAITVYESTDGTLDLPGDTQVGTQASVSLGLNSISITTSDIPNTTEYYYFATATIPSSSVTEGHAFTVAFATNHVSMDDGFDKGTAFSASDANNVTIAVTGTQLSLSTAPADNDVFDTGNDEVVSGMTFDTQPVVTVVDANSNVDLDFSENIVASLTSGSGSLAGTTTISPSSGVATFTNLAYTAASDGESFQITFDDAAGGADLTLVTTAGTLSADVIATQLVLTQQPSGVVNGSALSTQPIVTARDANSLTDTDFTDTIALTTSGTGSLTNQALAASSGVATFTTFQYTATVDQESVTFTADDVSGGSGGDLSSVTSSSLTASAGPATQLTLSFDSMDIQADGSSTKSVTVIVKDATGLKRSTDNATSVTLTVTGTGTGTDTKTVSSGQTVFTVTSSTTVGTVNLSATSSGLTGDTGSFATANIAPVANAQTVSATEDVDITVTFSGSDADGDAFSFLVSTLPANGALYQTSDGTTRGSSISSVPTTVTDTSNRVIYVSAQNGNGNGHGTFGIKANDGSANSSATTVTVNVTGTEDPPVASADNLTLDEDSPTDLNVLSNDSDPDGDALTVTSVSGASRGGLSINSDGTVRFAPSANYFGSDSFSYSISDGNGNSSTATATVTINSVNDSPVAQDDSVTIPQDERIRVMVLENDQDVESETLSVVGTSIPANGRVSLTSGRIVEYIPDDGFFGVDVFTYTAKDGDGGTSVGRVEITVERENRSPSAVSDSIYVQVADALPVRIDVLANDTDPDGDSVVLAGVKGSGLTLSVDVGDDGTILYVPSAFTGETDILSYTITDGFGGEDTGELRVGLELENTTPIAVNDSIQVVFQEVISFLPLVNDLDPDGDELTVLEIIAPDSLSLELDQGEIRFSPPGPGTFSYGYVIIDALGAVDSANVTVSVYLNIAPFATPDSVATRRGATVVIDVLANDFDENGDSLMVLGVVAGEGTQTALLSDGLITYTPTETFAGHDPLSYTVSDGNGGVTTGQIRVFVDSNSDPVARRDSVSTGVGMLVSVDILANDSDLDEDSLQVDAVFGGVLGSGILVDGRLQYSHGGEGTGLDSLNYVLSDGRGGLATGTAIVLILTEPPPGDLDGDFQAGPEDVVPFVGAFGATAGDGGFNEAFDLNGNGVVDFFDFLSLVELWSR